ncbi:MAG: NYN domain-containing protein [Pseudanabaena sp. M046S1SP1A06QC]|nr:NYN domain-containing protein [Pseudanabaena sp. M046S1SP1A06QC]
MPSPKIVAKIESEEATHRLAVLIDADNAQASIIEGLLEEIARLGEATVKRIYGDFTSPASSQWKKVLNKYAIKPVQQFAYTTGKNATDSTLIIDAMDLLYTRRFDGFCLVSSDSDFTGLALRIREEGLTVFGFGEQKTPEAFRNACHKFIFTEVLRQSTGIKTESELSVKLQQSETNISSTNNAKKQESVTELIIQDTNNNFPKDFILKALETTVSDDSGWTNLGTFGSYLTKLKPDFDVRLYGFKKLSDMVKKHTDVFQVDERSNPNSPAKDLYIRKK